MAKKDKNRQDKKTQRKVSQQPYEYSLIGKLDQVIENRYVDYYKILRDYSIIYPDFSQAVGNLIFSVLSMPDIVITFPESVSSDDKKKKLTAEITRVAEQLWERCYPSGVTGFTLDSIRQIAVFGALSVEAVVDRRGRSIQRFTHVPVESIRFGLRKDKSHVPLQKKQTTIAKSKDVSAYIKLDIPNYFYIPASTEEGLPYGIPPFLNTIPNLEYQKIIFTHLKSYAKKLGLMGFLNILINPPEALPHESPDAYTERVRQYVKKVADDQVEEFSRGVAVTVNGNAQYEFHQVSANGSNVEKVVQLNEEQIASGFNQDPALFGRTYSTTETYAGVVYDKFLSMLQSYTNIISIALRKILLMELEFNGIIVENIKINYKKPKSLTAKVDADAELTKTTTVMLKRDNNIIGQNEAARELGYDYADDEKPEVVNAVQPQNSSGGNRSGSRTSENNPVNRDS